MDWSTTRNTSAEYFGQLVRGLGGSDVLNLSTDSVTLYVGPMDWAWGSDDDIYKMLHISEGLYATRCNQVDMLIREAGLLIERALGEVLKYDELNLERFKVMIEFIEYDRIWSQQQAEQADLEYWNGLSKEAEFSKDAKTHASDLQQEIAQAYKTAVSGYDNARQYADQEKDELSRYNAFGAEFSTVASQHQYTAHVASNTSDSASHDARQKYEIRSRIHQLERQAITQEIIGIKLNELQRPHGALNYNERMKAAADRALNDFVEVNARLNAIAIGLPEFYGIEDLSNVYDEMKAARTCVEGALMWLRKATNALARARMDEQDCVVRLTIEPRDGKSGLLQELTDGRIVQFAGDVIAKLKRAHLKGISATAEALTGDSWLDLELVGPEQNLDSASIRLPGPMVRLGRVGSSASLNMRDVGGGRPIVDRAPVGDWQVRAVRHYGADQINRLHLDFQLVVCG